MKYNLYKIKYYLYEYQYFLNENKYYVYMIKPFPLCIVVDGLISKSN